MSREKTKRNESIIKLVDKGWSLKKVAQKFGFSTSSTVHEIYHRKEKRIAKERQKTQ